jgi:hypothetical protein
MIFIEPVCFRCKNFDMESSTCLAFLLEIPDEILNGNNDHTKPFPGDGGIQFEPID